MLLVTRRQTPGDKQRKGCLLKSPLKCSQFSSCVPNLALWLAWLIAVRFTFVHSFLDGYCSKKILNLLEVSVFLLLPLFILLLLLPFKLRDTQ